MSRPAIAAALARNDLSAGERLVAFSLASFADREDRARPGTPAAVARAGLERSGYLEARDRLVGRRLVVVEVAASGRGRASTLALPFASEGPWWEGEINAELFEAVLGYSRAKGSARLLVAAMAALSDERGVVDGLTTEELCAAAGISDRTYRRVNGPLLASGELVLNSSTGGRGNTNRWEVADPRAQAPAATPGPRRRVAPRAGVRPLVATVAAPVVEQLPMPVTEPVEGERMGQDVGAGKGGQDRTVSPQNRPALSGVSAGKGCQALTLSSQNRPALTGVSVLNPCQAGTLSPETPAETPAKTPAETPAAYARASREPQNPRTLEDPPSPPKGGSGADELVVEQTYITERGRTRRRLVTVDLAAVRARLRAAGGADLAAWEQVRALLLKRVGESTFEIWLAPLELLAVDNDGSLVLGTPAATRAWVEKRFGRLLEGCAACVGRGVRFAAECEQAAVGRRAGDARSLTSAGERSGKAVPAAALGSADGSSYTHVYNQQEEVS